MLSAVPANGAELVAHWTFDEDINDAFGATTTAFAGAAITRSDARVGPGCLSLQNSYLVVDPAPSLDTPEFTMTFWIYYDSSYRKWSLRQTGRADDAFETGYDGDQLLLYVKGQTPSWNSLFQPVKMDQWVHYAYVYKNGVLTAYENAIQVYQRSVDLGGRKGKQLIIGAGGGVLNNPQYYRQYALKGKIDDLRIYDGALDCMAIQAMVPACLTGICLADADPENNTEPRSYTNQTEILITFDGSSGGQRPTVHLATDPGFTAGCAIETWTAQRNTFGYSLSGSDGAKTVYARLETKPGEYGPVVSSSIILDTVPPRVKSLEINGGQAHTTTAHVGLRIAATDNDGGAMKFRVRDNGSQWTGWKELLAHLSHRLGKEDGKHSLEVQVCDNAGNVSADVVSDSITLELVPSPQKQVYRSFCYDDWLCEFIVNPSPMEPKYLDMLVDEAAKGGADVLVLNPNGQTTAHPSKVWQTMWKAYAAGDKKAALPHPDRYPAAEAFLKELTRFDERKIDYLAYTFAACRRRGIATGASIRMNDVHAAASERSFLVSDFAVEHPQFRLPGSAALNYAHPQVRDYFMKLIAEMIDDYDIDVLDLDFLRNAYCFPDDGKVEEHCQTMTSFIKEIHERIGKSKKRIALLVKVPSSVAYSRNCGFDVGRWAREGLIDGVILGGYLHAAWAAPVPEFRKIVGDRVAIYPAGDYFADTREKLPSRTMGLYADLMRGFAAGHLANGADGIYWFNFVVVREAHIKGMFGKPSHRDVDRPQFEAIGQSNTLDGLRGQPKIYIVSNFSQHGNARLDSPRQAPLDLKPGEEQAFNLLLAKEPESAKVEVALVFRPGNKDEKVEDLSLMRFNDKMLNAEGTYKAGPEDAYTALFTVSPSVMRDGPNEIVVRNGLKQLRIVAFEVRVK